MYIEIIPNLWVGKIGLLIDKFDIIINCSKHLHFLDKYNNYKLTNSINLVKDYEYLDELTTYIYKNLNNNKKILVICEDCIQKTPTVVCVYLIKYGKINLKEIILKLNTKGTFTFNNRIHYINILKRFEQKFLSL